MGVFFTILAFVTVLGIGIPAVNAVSPFSSSLTTHASTSLSSPYILGAAGCSTVGSSGSLNCTSSANSASSPSFFGVTQFIFGNFLAALVFVATMALAIFVPATYVLAWVGGPGTATAPNTAGIAVAGIVQALCSCAYANEFFYILSGRWIFPP